MFSLEIRADLSNRTVQARSSRTPQQRTKWAHADADVVQRKKQK